MRALARSVRAYPQVNAGWDDATNAPAAPKDSVGVALAADTAIGLLAPVIKDPDLLPIDEQDALIRATIAKARAGKLTGADLQGGTTTLSNLGGFGVPSFTSLLTPPQATSLSAGAISERPMVIRGGLTARLGVTVGLTIDHRPSTGPTVPRCWPTCGSCSPIRNGCWIDRHPLDAGRRSQPAARRRPGLRRSAGGQRTAARLGHHPVGLDDRHHHAPGVLPRPDRDDRAGPDRPHRQGLRHDPTAAYHAREKHFWGLIDQIEPIAGVVDLIRRLHRAGSRIAIASNGSRDYLEHVIDSLKVGTLIDGFVCADDITHPKPHPEPYLKAAQLLGVPPGECVAIEDSQTGVTSALAAGLRVIMVTSAAESTGSGRR